MKINVGRMPYLNSELFYYGLGSNGTWTLDPLVPSAMARAAREGTVDAGPIPLVDCFALEDSFEPLGDFCIATKHKARSILLFSKVPLADLAGRTIGITDETSTSARLLKVLLACHLGVGPAAYVGLDAGHDAFLLIGDNALRSRRGVPGYPFRYDLGELWHQWTGLPFVFALWIVRRELSPEVKAMLRDELARSVREGAGHLGEIASRRADLGMSEAEVAEYLGGFAFSLGPEERTAIERFRALLEKLPQNG